MSNTGNRRWHPDARGQPDRTAFETGENPMAAIDPDFTSMQRAVWDAMAAHWKLFMFQGVAMIVLGVLAVLVPMGATLVIELFIGWLFLVSGVVGLIALFSVHNTPAFL